jgi:hypothetical protein
MSTPPKALVVTMVGSLRGSTSCMGEERATLGMPAGEDKEEAEVEEG